MSDASQAVFLSYASQDVEAAKRICEALRAAGIEVWFDQSELVGGDQWDAKIRGQIGSCALFIPVISANTQARLEGYFRIEWKLAAQRTHAMAEEKPFLLPVLIDATRDNEAKVPAEFRAVQWTKLAAQETSAAFTQRVKKLLDNSEDTAKPSHAENKTGESDATTASPPRKISRRWLTPAILGVALIAATTLVFLAKRETGQSAQPAEKSAAHPPIAAAQMSEARQLVAKARQLFDGLDGTRDDIKLAEEYLNQAIAKDGNDAEAWAALAQLHTRALVRGWDLSDKRREDARVAAHSARRLDPRSFEARFTWYPFPWATARELQEGESALRALHEERPEDHRVLRALANTVQALGRRGEANAIRDESARLPGGDALALYDKARSLWNSEQLVEAEAALHASLQQQPFASSLLLNLWFTMELHGDLDRAKTILDQIAPSALLEDRGCYYAYTFHWLRREPDAALTYLRALPRDWITDNWYRGPKGTLVGDALHLAGRNEAAALEWRGALKLVDALLAANPTELNALYSRAVLLGRLGEREEGSRVLGLVEQMIGDWKKLNGVSRTDVAATLVILGRHAEALQLIAHELEGVHRFVFFPSADLRLNPCWDPLRSDPEFTRLIAVAVAKETTAGEQKPEPASVKVDEKSVAVLAFANLSDDKGNEYFSDGISEELLNVLAKIPGLKVSARTSAFYFKGKQVPIADIAKQLGVAYVVEGSVRKSGSRVRITAQLIKAQDGFHMWSENFDRELKDIFAVQDEIAGLISKNLQLKMGVVSSESRREVNPEAHRLVLEGRHFWNLRTTEGFAKAEAAFTKAIALDPQFAQAHAGLADVLITKTIFQSYAGFNDGPVTAAREEIGRALALDSALAEAYPASGAVLMWEGRLPEAEQEFRKAIALNSNYALAHHWYSLVLELQGRLDIALAEIDQAIRLDPLSISALATRERFLVAAGRFPEALAADDQVRALRPDFLFIAGERALCLLNVGRKDDAIAVARSIGASETMDTRWMKDAAAIHVLRQTGHESEAAAQVAALLPRLPTDSYLRGTVLAVLGRWDEAVPFLERTPVGLQEIYYWNPVWDAWRDDPRFSKLIAKLGCAEEYKVARETRSRMLKERSVVAKE